MGKVDDLHDAEHQRKSAREKGKKPAKRRPWTIAFTNVHARGAARIVSLHDAEIGRLDLFNVEFRGQPLEGLATF